MGNNNNKKVYTYNEILVSLKKKEILLKCYNMNEHKDVMLNKINQSQKDKYSMIPRI